MPSPGGSIELGSCPDQTSLQRAGGSLQLLSFGFDGLLVTRNSVSVGLVFWIDPCQRLIGDQISLSLSGGNGPDVSGDGRLKRVTLRTWGWGERLICRDLAHNRVDVCPICLKPS